MVITENHDKPDLIRKFRDGKERGVIYSNGYRFIRKPSHPNVHPNGYIAEHRLVMEKHLGRLLNESEYIHHINGNKVNNEVENLLLTNVSEHRAIHNIQDKKGERKYDVEIVRELYLQGYSARKIEEKLGIGKSTVISYVNELGITRPNIYARCSEGKFKREAI